MSYQELKNQLNEAKNELNIILEEEREQTQKKILKELINIKRILDRTECHSNETRKLNRFMAEMLFYDLYLRPQKTLTNHDEFCNKKWKEFLRIRD